MNVSTITMDSTLERWIPDHSAVASFRENPEGFRLKYRLHLAPARPDDKMQAGSAIHAARNVLFSGGDLEAAVAQALAIRGEGTVRGPAHVERVVRAYAARYPRHEEPFNVVCSEEYAEVRICVCGLTECFHESAFDYCGILDSVVRFPDGSEYVMDLKTTGSYLNEGWCNMMSLSDQMTGYVAIRRALGHRCDGYLVDGVHISDYVRKDGTINVDLAKDFVRYGPVQVPEWRVERWARDMQYTLAQIAQLERERGLAQPWPLYQNWPYGKVDAYREFYETPAELHEQTMQLFERKTWSPREVAEGRAVTTPAAVTP